jgi:phosphohistidine phosphatase SixA
LSLLLVRHAVAVSRHDWPSDDRLRPLNDKGFAQSRALVDVLAGHRIEVIVSSPAVRCVQTVEPLAAALGLDVVEDAVLWESMPLAPVRRLVGDLDHAVLCSHGDLIPDLVDHLIAEGMEAVGRDCKKGSTWVIERDGPAFARGTYLPPPKVQDRHGGVTTPPDGGN